MSDDSKGITDHPVFDQSAGIDLPFGTISSPEAQKLFRNSILTKATCPICAHVGMVQMDLKGHSEAREAETLTFTLPMAAPPSAEIFPAGAVQVGVCMNCGYMAQFLDVIITTRYAAHIKDTK